MNNLKKMSRLQLGAFFAYELVGTMLLVLIFNILAVQTNIDETTPAKTVYLDTGAYSFNFTLALFALTFICWDVAPAQFNSGLALGMYAHEITSSPIASLLPFISSVVAQFIGAFLGYIITTQVVYKEDLESNPPSRYMYEYNITSQTYL